MTDAFQMRISFSSQLLILRRPSVRKAKRYKSLSLRRRRKWANAVYKSSRSQPQPAGLLDCLTSTPVVMLGLGMVPPQRNPYGRTSR